jgi:hypothetical protein
MVVDVQALIDTHPLSAVQKRLLLLCFFVRRHRRLRSVTTVDALVAIPALVAAAALLTLGANGVSAAHGAPYCTGVQG